MSKRRSGGFGNFGGGNNMQQLMQQARQMQTQMEEIQKNLENEMVETQAGGGTVKAKMNGKQELVELTIDPSALEDAEILQDMVKAAVNEATRRAKEISEKAMGGALGNISLPPGLF